MADLTDRERWYIDLYLEEDSGRGDPSAEGLEHIHSTALVIAQERCVLSGVEAVGYLFASLGCDMEAEEGAVSGEWVEPGIPLLRIKGRASSLLAGERTALNILSRMSSVATISRIASDGITAVNPRCRAAGTRKTTPGFTLFEKRALSDGGALPHRYSLSDMPMVKDNHLAVLEDAGMVLHEALAGMKVRYGPYMLLEVEVEDIRTALTAVDAGADIVLIDNKTPKDFSDMARAVRARAAELGRQIVIEASGGIDTDRAISYARDADVISMGCLTNPTRIVQFKMEMTR